MSDDKTDRIQKAASAQARVRRIILALKAMESSRYIVSDMDVSAGFRLAADGLLGQALRDLAEAQDATQAVLFPQEGTDCYDESEEDKQ